MYNVVLAVILINIKANLIGLFFLFMIKLLCDVFMNNNMKYEKEITVEVDTDIESLINILENEEFNLSQEYVVHDIYMVKKDTNLKDDIINIFNNCILIRNIITDKNNYKCITYKYKECNNVGDIIKNGKVNCYIQSVDEGIKLFEALDYKQLLSINDRIMVYSNNNSELAVQIVNNKHTYIEIEENCEFINKHYDGIDDMKLEISKYNIPIKNNDYFVKKAHIEFKELYGDNNDSKSNNN